jgi:hypothetical protein
MKPIIKDVNKEVTKALVTLRIEKLSGKVILEKDNDMVMRNLVRMLYFLMANYCDDVTPSISCIDIGGNTRTGTFGASGSTTLKSVRYVAGYYNSPPAWYNLGGVGIDTNGIVIGRGAVAPTRVDYVLGDKITHGGGATQISYNQQTYDNPNDYQFRLIREFTNAGGALAVTESGLIYYASIPSGATNYAFLLLRDTFAAVNVTTGNGIRVRYTFSF